MIDISLLINIQTAQQLRDEEKQSYAWFKARFNNELTLNEVDALRLGLFFDPKDDLHKVLPAECEPSLAGIFNSFSINIVFHNPFSL